MADEEQLKIFEVWQKYKNDEEYRKQKEDNYINNPTSLNLYEIYVLEELVRFGNKNYYNDIIKTKQNDNQNIYLEYEMLIKMCNNNQQFLDDEIKKLESKSLFLSSMEIYVLKNFYKDEIEKSKKSNYKYDAFVELKYGIDKEIKNTVYNILVGNIVYEYFNDNTKMKTDKKLSEIKLRQKEPGMIASEDKPYIIEKIKSSIFDDYDKFEEKANSMFTLVKYSLYTGKKEAAFKPFIKQRTNIKNTEVGLEDEFEIADFFGVFDGFDDPFGFFKKKK